MGMLYSWAKWNLLTILNVVSLKPVTDSKQDGRVEGLQLTSYHENTKITTNCWTTIDETGWNLPKKIFYIQRQRRSHNEMVQGAHLWYNQIHNCQGGDWRTKNNYIAEVLPQEWEFWDPEQDPQPEGLALGRGTPRAFDFEGQWAWVQELHRTGGNRDSTLGGHTQGSMCTGAQDKAVTP